jgi:hypothetical protein
MARNNRRGCLGRRARSAPAVFNIFALNPKKTFSRASVIFQTLSRISARSVDPSMSDMRPFGDAHSMTSLARIMIVGRTVKFEVSKLADDLKIPSSRYHYQKSE